MDCSQFSTTLTPEAHAVLQYMTRYRTSARGDFKRGLLSIQNALQLLASDVHNAVGLLRDVEALKLRDEDNFVYTVLLPCTCQDLILQQLPGSSSPVTLSSYVLDNHLSTSTRIVGTDLSPCLLTNPGFVRPEAPSSKRKKPRKVSLNWANKETKDWHAGDLAGYFASSLVTSSRKYRDSIGGQINDGALRSTFARWAREGWSPEVMRLMIENFTSNPTKWTGRNVPAWKSFIKNALRLHDEAATTLLREMDDFQEAPIGLGNVRFAAVVRSHDDNLVTQS